MGDEERHGGLMELVIVGEALFMTAEQTVEVVSPSTTGMGMI